MKINEFIPNKGIYSKLLSKNMDKVEKEDNIPGFGEALKEKLNDLNEKQLEAEEVTEQFLNGEDVDIHQVMIKGEEAKLSLELAVQIRNKLVEAYQEINRMQV